MDLRGGRQRYVGDLNMLDEMWDMDNYYHPNNRSEHSVAVAADPDGSTSQEAINPPQQVQHRIAVETEWSVTHS